MTRPRLAIVSPNQNVYSETFIQAHRRLLDADIRYYFGGAVPRQLEGRGGLQRYSLAATVGGRLRRRLLHSDLTVEQLAFLDSLRRERVQVVLAEYGVTGAAILPVCRQLGLPLIVHFHGFDASVRSVLERHRAAYQAMFDYATFVIAVSRVMEQRLLELGCPRDKLVYNVYGPDDAFFDIEPADPAPRRFIAVGRFVDKKAPHCTVLAFRQVLEQFPDAVLTMGGNGPLWAACQDLVRYFGLSNNVMLPGVLTPEQVCQELANAAAFVQHSVTGPDGDMEGTPNTVLEAAAAGLPVVATRHAGIPDVVVHGETGLLVDEHDVDGMAQQLCRILAQPEQARSMGQTGRQRMREHFTMARSIGQLDVCVAQALAGPQQPAVIGRR